VSSPIEAFGRDDTEELARIALDIALAAPPRLVQPTTYVRSRHVNAAREILERHGVDWLAIVKRRAAEERSR
jgi:hypothetical protein